MIVLTFEAVAEIRFGAVMVLKFEAVVELRFEDEIVLTFDAVVELHFEAVIEIRFVKFWMEAVLELTSEVVADLKGLRLSRPASVLGSRRIPCLGLLLL